MKKLAIFHILFIVCGARNSILSAMRGTSNKERRLDDSIPHINASVELMDAEDLTSSFDQLTVSPALANCQYLSVDDGYYSQSINSKDFTSCDNGNGEDNTESDVNNVCFHEDVKSDVESDVKQYFSQNGDGDTKLHLAIIHGQEVILKWLISIVKNPDWLNIPNRLLQTPLHLAVIVKDAITIRRLMTSGARVDVRDVHGNTPLHIACREGSTDIVSCLLRPVTYTETLQNNYQIPYQRIPQDLEPSNYDGYNCLHLAAMETHLNVLDLLLARGAKVNAREHKSGRTVLHHAAETNNLELLVYLLKQRRVDINAETYGGMTPLRLAAGRNHTRVIEILLKNGAHETGDEDSFEDT